VTSIFRFAIQTREKRHSEVWSFFCNKHQQCLYATRTSMRHWLKVSFHKTGECHLKSYGLGADGKKDEIGHKDHVWRHADANEGEPIQIMRVVYDLRAQRGDFELHKDVMLVFEGLANTFSVYLNVFFIHSDRTIEVDDEAGIVATHHMGGRKWVYFSIDTGPLTDGLPEGIGGMVFHMGDRETDVAKKVDVLRNVTVVCYQVPEPSGVFVAFEASAARFPLSSPA